MSLLALVVIPNYTKGYVGEVLEAPMTPPPDSTDAKPIPDSAKSINVVIVNIRTLIQA